MLRSFLYAGPLIISLHVEIKAWKLLFGKHLNFKYKEKMDKMGEFSDEYAVRLSRPIKDLEDVRQAMAALESIRQQQIEIDMGLGPIEVNFAINSTGNSINSSTC